MSGKEYQVIKMYVRDKHARRALNILLTGSGQQG